MPVTRRIKAEARKASEPSNTLPMTIDADACLGMTLAVMRSRLNRDDLEFLHKAMELYAALRVQAILSKQEEE